MTLPGIRYLPAFLLLLIVLLMHWQMWRWLSANRAAKVKRSAGLALAAIGGFLIVGFSLGVTRVVQRLPPGDWIAWLRAAALGWGLLSIGFFFGLLLWRRVPGANPGRRRFLKTAGGIAMAAPVAACGFGVFVERVRLTAREVDLRMDDLPPALDGLRLVQLTDIHLSPFLSEKDLARAVGMANEFRAHLALVTGDLITDRGDPLDACLLHLSRLRASEGIYGCFGNHEGYTRTQAYADRQARRLGMDFLRGESRLLHIGDSLLNLAGVDYQRMGGPYLAGAERLPRVDCFNVLLSHNPDVFPVAVDQGFDLTIAGHTHGGQLTFEVPGLPLTVARLFTSYIYGVYREMGSAMYVSRGIGTVGIPMRFGAPPEVTMIRLRRGGLR